MMKRIALLSPAGAVDHSYVHGAVQKMRSWGIDPVVMPQAIGHETGRYAAPLAERVEDFLSALKNPEIDAILCTRGGYGCVQLLPYIPVELVAANPKPLIGFSDVTALHALWHRAGVPSVHGPMVKHICEWEQWLEPAEVRGEPNTLNRPGEATGILVGGNWAVLSGLAGTPYNMLGEQDTILFLEDIGEAAYKIDRMLYQLYLNGAFERIKGLVFGCFTDCRPDSEYGTIEKMISAAIEKFPMPPIPVAFGLPIGHIAANRPVTITAPYHLRVGAATILSPGIRD